MWLNSKPRDLLAPEETGENIPLIFCGIKGQFQCQANKSREPVGAYGWQIEEGTEIKQEKVNNLS